MSFNEILKYIKQVKIFSLKDFLEICKEHKVDKDEEELKDIYFSEMYYIFKRKTVSREYLLYDIVGVERILIIAEEKDNNCIISFKYLSNNKIVPFNIQPLVTEHRVVEMIDLIEDMLN